MGKEFDIGTRIQALTLHSEGYSRSQIVEKTGYTTNGFSYLLTKAKKRGYKPGEGPILREYVDTASGKGRPTVLTTDRTNKIIQIVTANSTARKFSAQDIVDKFHEANGSDRSISKSSVLKALSVKGFKKVNGVWQSKTGN
ncbi:hypothetical protein SAMD00023353_0501750 [Rosellinia necatrix]|uniref:Uncharacterized protein n=1 Tax=Rosellinia necatrix TaxID=77044 RepID=A0A1S8A5V8_ROSNE|nr:hypothetical protein SAMD00023353_0501750 [Rosellinia necatrix]